MNTAYNRHKIFLSFILLIGIITLYITVVKFRHQQNGSQHFVPITNFDLNEIIKRGKIIALTDNSSTSFYIYKGDSMGYEYELLDAFAKKNRSEIRNENCEGHECNF